MHKKLNSPKQVIILLIQLYLFFPIKSINFFNFTVNCLKFSHNLHIFMLNLDKLTILIITDFKTYGKK